MTLLRIILKIRVVMIVCSCRGVTCRRIRKEVRNGAHTLTDVRLRCRAGGVCGACRPQIAEIISEEVAVESDDSSCLAVSVGGNSAAA